MYTCSCSYMYRCNNEHIQYTCMYIVHCMHASVCIVTRVIIVYTCYIHTVACIFSLAMYMYMYICRHRQYICTCTCMYICCCIHVCTCTCMYMYMYVHVHVCTFVVVYMYVYVHCICINFVVVQCTLNSPNISMLPPTGAISVRSEEAPEEEKRNQWTELEIRGPIKNLSPELWKLTHLTALFLNDNNLQVH